MARRRPLLPVGPAGRSLTLAAALALALAALLVWWMGRGDVPEPAPAAWPEWFSAEQVAADAGYRRGLWVLAALGLPITPALALGMACWGRWRAPVAGLTRGRIWLAGAVAGAGLALAVAGAHLPLGLAGLAWRRHHSVSRQPVLDWLGDAGAAAMVQVIVFAAVGMLLAIAIARFPRGWWAALVAIAASVIVVTGALAPLVIEPLFESTRPLADRELAADARALADAAGVEVGDVVVSDASARTRTINARVSGIGPSRRIVLYDTLVDGVPRGQARFVIAHELAHVHHRHVLVGSAWAIAFLAPAALAIFGLVGLRTGVDRPAPGAPGSDLVLRRLALALALATVAIVLAAPLAGGVSRHLEAQADWTALRLTDDPDSAIGLQRELVRLRRGDPEPPALVQLWFGTHPTPIQRVGLALRFGEGR